MTRSPAERIAFIASIVAGVTPFIIGALRAMQSGDLRVLWMALVASLFSGGVLAAAVGRRRARRAVFGQSTAIFVVATLLAVLTAFLNGTSADAGVWAVSAAMGLCLAASSALMAMARPSVS